MRCAAPTLRRPAADFDGHHGKTDDACEKLQEWDEQKINEGRLAGREEGREEERARLRRLAERHFDAATANKLVHLINAADDRTESS